ncbi:MAG: hypothetical protein AB8G18_04085 [Gammaproteobacteria bacterium]
MTSDKKNDVKPEHNDWTPPESQKYVAVRSRKPWVLTLLLIGLSSLTIRALFSNDFGHSSLLYIAVPFGISVLIAAFRPINSTDEWWHAYRDHIFFALVVFLGSSIVLFEGFICVLFFMPIYFFVVTVMFFLRHWYRQARAKRRGNTLAFALPVLILATSFEGTTDSLSFERDSRVTVIRNVSLSAPEILSNIALPFDLQKERGWLISIFPMPYHIEAGSLQSGDVHRVHTRYHRWFATNTHEGMIELQIVDVEPNRVSTRFISDTSYFASYLTAKKTEIVLREISPTETEITLHIDYERKLDPAWYFHPLQQFGVTQMADFLIDEVMIRENSN